MPRSCQKEEEKTISQIGSSDLIMVGASVYRAPVICQTPGWAGMFPAAAHGILPGTLWPPCSRRWASRGRGEDVTDQGHRPLRSRGGVQFLVWPPDLILWGGNQRRGSPVRPGPASRGDTVRFPPESPCWAIFLGYKAFKKPQTVASAPSPPPPVQQAPPLPSWRGLEG